MKHVKKIVLWTLVAFAIYAVITNPSQAASIVQSIWSIIVHAFASIGSFFDAILKRN